MMQTPTSSYPGGAMPSSNDPAHSVPACGHASPPLRSQKLPQQAEPLQFGMTSAVKQPVPLTQALMSPQGSPSGMSCVVKMHRKSLTAEKQARPSLQS